MKEKLTTGQLVSVSCMLFSIFFGAGNMIFPPAMGQLAGQQFGMAMLGFIVTDVGIAVLGVVAVVFAGTNMQDLAGRIGPRFSAFITVAVYLLIGPLFALPRTGSVSFQLGIVPFLPKESALLGWSVGYTLLFFGLTYFLSLNPKKIVDIVGKVLTPFLLISIGVIFVMSVLHPVGTIGAPSGAYQQTPFFEGLVQGYLALDGFAGLVFAITVTNSLKTMGIHTRKGLLKYSSAAGLCAAFLLILVYGALTFIGAQTSGFPAFANGGALLSSVTNTLFGSFGNFIIGVAVILACLTTSIGLTTSFGDYFASLMPRIPYKVIIFGISAFSFVISNIGLNTLISIVLPILVMLYPVVTVMIVLSFFQRFTEGRPMIAILGMSCAFFVSFFDGLKTAGLCLPVLSDLASRIPYFNLGIGWLLPSVAGCLLGFLIQMRGTGAKLPLPKSKKKKEK